LLRQPAWKLAWERFADSLPDFRVPRLAYAAVGAAAVAVSAVILVSQQDQGLPGRALALNDPLPMVNVLPPGRGDVRLPVSSRSDFPPHYVLPDTGKLRIFGYTGFVQLSSNTATTDMDVTAISSMRVWVQAEAFNRLLSDRVAFQQWQVQSGNSDVSALSLNQIALSNQARIRREETRLRRMRRLG
jgi:hypothetical protein